MTAIHWLNPISDSFTNPADWSGGAVPGAADDAIIDSVGAAPYTVTASAAETVSSLQTGAQATVAISHATFTATAGSGAGANAGVILIGAGGTFAAGGTVDNTGLIQLGAGKGADALLADGQLTLSGGGRVFMTDSERNKIGGGKASVLTNLDNTIFGSGLIGTADYRFELTNAAEGVIDATGALPLSLRGYVLNNGLLEATGKGGLIVTGFVQGRTDGVILANGSAVRLTGAHIYGGTLDTAGAGMITLSGGKLRSVTNAGQLTVIGSSVWEEGLVNRGTVTVGAPGGGSVSLLGETLAGRGSVSLTLGAGNLLGFAENVDNTITGSGQLGPGNYGGVVLANDVLGVIDANSSSALSLVATTITNAGLIEDNGIIGPGAYLSLFGTDVVNSGTILSASAEARVEIEAHSLGNSGLISSTGLAGATLTASGGIRNTGVLSVSGGGTMTVSGRVTGTGRALIDDATLIFTSTFSQNVTFTGTSGELELGLSESFARTITGFSAAGATSLDLGDVGFVSADEASFSGDKHGGVLTVTDGIYTARLNLAGDFRHAVFVASSDGDHGVIIVAEAFGEAAPPAGRASPAPPHGFIAAMASVAPRAGEASRLFDRPPAHEAALARPRVEAA